MEQVVQKTITNFQDYQGDEKSPVTGFFNHNFTADFVSSSYRKRMFFLFLSPEKNENLPAFAGWGAKINSNETDVSNALSLKAYTAGKSYSTSYKSKLGCEYPSFKAIFNVFIAKLTLTYILTLSQV